LHAERNDIQGQLDKLAKEVTKQAHKLDLLEFKASQDGVVKDLPPIPPAPSFNPAQCS
jgi:hypothetical protein